MEKVEFRNFNDQEDDWKWILINKIVKKLKWDDFMLIYSIFFEAIRTKINWVFRIMVEPFIVESYKLCNFVFRDVGNTRHIQ